MQKILLIQVWRCSGFCWPRAGGGGGWGRWVMEHLFFILEYKHSFFSRRRSHLLAVCLQSLLPLHGRDSLLWHRQAEGCQSHHQRVQLPQVQNCTGDYFSLLPTLSIGKLFDIWILGDMRGEVPENVTVSKLEGYQKWWRGPSKGSSGTAISG